MATKSDSDIFDLINTKSFVFEPISVLPKDTLKVVVYKNEANEMKLGKLIDSRDSKSCRVLPLKIQIPKNITNTSDILEYLSNEIRANNKIITLPEIACDLKNIEPYEYYFITYDSLGKNLGKFGTLQKINKNQYLIDYKKKFTIKRSDTKQEKGVVKIMKGVYKNRMVNILRSFPATVSVYINALGKSVTSHLIKIGNNFVNKPITPEDVFYLDLELKNGNYFEVKSINDDIISGTEKDSGKYIPRNISYSEIKMKMPGFDFLESDDVQYLEPIYEEIDGEKEVEITDEEEDEVSEFVDSEEPKEKEINEDEYKASFKDIERTFAATVSLSSKQQEIQKTVKKILAIYNINEDDEDIKIYNIIQETDDSIKKIQTALSSMKISDWSKSDEKYIVASLLLYEILKKGFRLQTEKADTLTNYIKKLTDKKILNKKDIDTSLFISNKLPQYFEVDSNVIKKLIKNKDYDSIFKIMMTNCIQILTKWFGKISIEDIKYSEPIKIVPISRKENKQLSLTTKDIVTIENYWNIKEFFPYAKKIIWAPKFSVLIEKFKKEKLEPKLQNPVNNTTERVYTYIYKNIDRAPFAEQELLELIKKDKKKIDYETRTRLMEVFDELMIKVKELYKQITKEREEGIAKLEEEKLKSLRGREEKMKKRAHKLNQDEDMEENVAKISKINISEEPSESVSDLFDFSSEDEE